MEAASIVHFWADIRTYQLALEYIRVLVWPMTVLSTMFYFRKELSDLLKRLQEIKYKEFTLNTTHQKTPTDEVPQEVQDEIKETIDEKREEIRSKENFPASATNEQLQEQVSALLNQVATIQSAYQFERIYNLIFGTQIMTLENLRKNMNGLWHVALDSWYQEARTSDPILKDYSFNDYIGFLLNAKLIQPIETTGGRKYILTDLGTDFLNYVEKSNLPRNKPH